MHLLCRVATLILSYFNDTILNQLGDIESYLASYLYKNRKNMTLYAARVASGKPCCIQMESLGSQ